MNASLRAHIGGAARYMDNAVILRWGVDKPTVLFLGFEAGYIIDRAESTDGRIPPATAFTTLTKDPVLPWSAEAWSRYFANAPQVKAGEPDHAMVAASVLEKGQYGGVDDGGGDEREIQERRSMLDMRHSFAMIAADRSSAAAEGLGLRFADASVTRGRTYAYRIRFAGTSPVYRVDTGYVVVRAVPYAPPTRAGALQADENDGSITLFWPAFREYSSYTVQRSDDGGKTFSAITRAPLITLRAAVTADTLPESFLDSNVVNYRPFVYRVHGATAFGTEELVGEVKAMGRDRTHAGIPFVPQPKQTATRAVTITWTMEEPLAADLAGFAVMRDTSDKGAFVPIVRKLLPKTARTYVDTSFSEDEANYYMVASVDTAGNLGRSHPAYVALIDSIPPAAPVWIRGTMDSSGVVTLRLRTNRERDCMGYRILRANDPSHEFSSIIEAYGDDRPLGPRDTLLTDTVDVMSLTRNVYYVATALDRNYNESGFSAVLAVPRPDLVPPAAPVISDVTVMEKAVVFTIVPSPSEDAASHIMFRRSERDTAWRQVMFLGPQPVAALDTGVVNGVRYEYALQAVDSAGLRSPWSETVYARPYDSGIRPGVTALSARYDEKAGSIRVSWDYGAQLEAGNFVVYRSVNGGGLKTMARLTDAAARGVVDTDVARGSRYEYAVKVFTRSGAESLPVRSQPVDCK